MKKMPEERLVDVSKMAESGMVIAKPIVYKGAVYCGAADTFFYCLDLKTGRKKWTYKTNSIIASTAIAKDDIIYFGCSDKNIYAIGTDGMLRWKYRTNGYNISSPFICGDTIYFGSCDHNLYAVDLKTHNELWHFSTGDEILGDPLVYKDRIYFGSMDSYFYCLDLGGNLLWKFKTGESIMIGWPAASENMIYFGSGDQKQYALTLDGELVWEFVTGEVIFNAPHICGDMLYFGGRDRYVYALDKKTGICRWKFITGMGLPAPVIFNGRAYVASDKIYCLTISGHKIWEFDIGTFGSDKAEITEDGCFFGAFDAKIRRISLDGQLIWEFRTNGVVPSPSIFKGVLPTPKWDPNRFDEKGTPVGPFNPYTLLKEGDELKKYMGGVDTTLEPYVGIPREIGQYRDAGMEASKAYHPKEAGKKKKDLLEEILDEERRKRPFGG